MLKAGKGVQRPAATMVDPTRYVNDDDVLVVEKVGPWAKETLEALLAEALAPAEERTMEAAAQLPSHRGRVLLFARLMMAGRCDNIDRPAARRDRLCVAARSAVHRANAAPAPQCPQPPAGTATFFENEMWMASILPVSKSTPLRQL